MRGLPRQLVEPRGGRYGILRKAVPPKVGLLEWKAFEEAGMGGDDLCSLVTQAQAGDVRAYGEIVRRFQDMAYGYAHSLLGDFHLAEDAAQEAFIEAYRCLPKLREPAAFSGWLRRIVFKRCDRLTRPKQVCTVPLESVGSVASKSPGPPQKAERREMRDKALDAIRSLPDAERTVTTLHYIDGYSQKDVADFLEVPVTTVNNRLHASRQRLKERMIAMVADELNASKPGGEFQELVEEAIRRQGKGAFNDAVALCGRALGAAQEGDLERVADLYFEIYDSYQKTGEVEALPTGMFSAVPDQPSDGRVVAALNVLHCVVQGFLHAHLPERAQGTAQRGNCGAIWKQQKKPSQRFVKRLRPGGPVRQCCGNGARRSRGLTTTWRCALPSTTRSRRSG